MNLRSVIGVTALLFGVVACGGKGAPEQAAAPTPSAQAPALAESSPAAAMAGSPAVDIASLKACEIVTPQEAAAIIGGKLLNEPPAGFSNCAYVVEVDGMTESYRLSFSAPAMHEAMLEAQSVAERGESIAGLWGEAYLQSRAPEKGYSLVALQRGRLALEVWGDRKEPLIELARLAVSRVP
ncbi:MAG: hypothetical protein V9E93_11935 [Steroidobacteraceae bacterium]|nr:hypothetical protein [Steroidobacteraceae bacterium]MBP7012786.1 hypothetical protein [Steroidobacteraceae bacterium]